MGQDGAGRGRTVGWGETVRRSSGNQWQSDDGLMMAKICSRSGERVSFQARKSSR